MPSSPDDPFDKFEDFDDEPFDDEDKDLAEECGRWRNGKLGPWSECLHAGSEFCAFDCPYRR